MNRAERITKARDHITEAQRILAALDAETPTSRPGLAWYLTVARNNLDDTQNRLELLGRQ